MVINHLVRIQRMCTDLFRCALVVERGWWSEPNVTPRVQAGDDTDSPVTLNNN